MAAPVPRAVLVFPRASVELARRHVPPEGARVIAIDAGAQILREAARVPDDVVGDMDSISADTLSWARDAGARVHVHPPRKRDTDAALALALVPAADEVLFVGAGGGRPDHALANLHLLASRHGLARGVDDDVATWVVAPGRPLALDLPEGTVLSAFAFDTRCTGITYEGLDYALRDAEMHAGDPYGISNVCLAPPQRIRVSEGRLVVMRPLAARTDEDA